MKIFDEQITVTAGAGK